MTKREEKFCCYYSSNGNVRISAVMAGYGTNPEQVGLHLLLRSDITDRINKYRKAKLNLLDNLAVVGYERLAFGSIADCIQLLYMDKPEDVSKIEQMDLFMISEIKKPKDGSMEIKFFDRSKALEKLVELKQSSLQNTMPLYKALENSAELFNGNGVDFDDT